MGSRSSRRQLNLGEGVRILRVGDLPGAIRARVDQQGESFAVTNPRGRAAPVLVDGETAELLQEFRRPCTIVDAIVRSVKKRGSDPERTLKAAYPILQRLVARRFLVWAEGDRAAPPQSGVFEPGDWLDDLEIVRLVQLMEDTAVYQARTRDGRTSGLKIERGGGQGLVGSLADEAEILRGLEGDPAPALLRVGDHDGCRYLLMEWCAGSDAMVATAEWRTRADPASRQRLVDVCRRITEAYARLHRCRVIHGDVHSSNILVDRDDRVRLVDFGLARCHGDGSSASAPKVRGGVPLFFEPECARALLTRGEVTPIGEAGEQYALAALVYQLLTGLPYLDFRLERDEMLRQILEEPPVAFEQRGLGPWPEMETVLARALAKEPEERFPSVAVLAQRLATVSIPEQSGRSATARAQTERALARFPDGLLRKAGLDGPWLNEEQPPCASLFLGAAGIAYALYRIACLRDQPAVLSLADVWSCRAESQKDRDEAPFDPELDIGRDRIEPSSPYHRASGIHFAQALIGAALAEPGLHTGAVEAYLATSQGPSVAPDLATGRSGSLLTAALLLDTWSEATPFDRAPLLQFGHQALAGLWKRLAAEPRVSDTVGDLGIAHGWAGFLYATLQWCRAARTDLPPTIDRRLRELADLAQPVGRGLQWPWCLPMTNTTEPQFMPGWCNGSAGFVFLWNLAARLLDDPSLLDLAIGAGWNAWESSPREGTLCCGLVGRSYALLRLYRSTGETIWLDRARDLARFAAAQGRFDTNLPHSLFKGELALALLAVDLEVPERAVLPLFEQDDERR